MILIAAVRHLLPWSAIHLRRVGGTAHGLSYIRAFATPANVDLRASWAAGYDPRDTGKGLASAALVVGSRAVLRGSDSHPLPTLKSVFQGVVPYMATAASEAPSVASAPVVPHLLLVDGDSLTSLCSVVRGTKVR
jgi:hypothetical protein